MGKRSIRVGIDVGGTHTKAVAIDNSTNKIVGAVTVMTTHYDKSGVAAGVVEAFNKCLNENNISPDEVIFIAHSTTQATNALLEGDVANVGIIGIGKGGIEGFLAKKQTNIKDIDLGTGKFIRICHAFRKSSQLSDDVIKDTINELLQKGAKVIVASKAFGVDSMTEEREIARVAEEMNVPCTIASDITKLYGLTTRTRTAAINASILPKMLDTATSTQESVKNTGVKVPLMIMRGDGGVMEVSEMKKRPILTMLSGPAASVVGALMYLRASNGIYFEVGGTSVNVGVIKDGRPAVDYSIIGGHRTYVNSLDVRVLGIAGGSMVRIKNGQIIDVGPRSAHIADLDYAAFTPVEEIEEPKLYYVQPRKNDPSDYAAIKLKNGKSITITNTCAANALGLIPENDYAHGSRESCRKAMEPLAKEVNMTVDEAAKEILRISCSKIIPVINDLIFKYKLEKDQIIIVGAGGGASVLIPGVAKEMELKYKIPDNAEMISSIGVALAMVREMVERVVPNPTAEDIAKIKKEARERAINSGAVPDSIEVYTQIDEQTQRITAIAMGSTEVKTTDLMKNCTVDDAKKIAAESFGVPANKVNVEAENGHIFVFSALKGSKNQIRIIDKKGFIKVQRGNGSIEKCTYDNIEEGLKKLWDECNNFTGEIKIPPDVFVIAGSRVIDYSGVPKLDQVTGLAKSELLDFDKKDTIILVGAKNEI